VNTADFPTSAPAGYDDLFPCPEGDQAMAHGEAALKAGNLTLARKLQQDAVDFYTEAFAVSKNLAAIESLDQRIGIKANCNTLCNTYAPPTNSELSRQQLSARAYPAVGRALAGVLETSRERARGDCCG
jgi:hypothetical protein